MSQTTESMVEELSSYAEYIKEKQDFLQERDRLDLKLVLPLIQDLADELEERAASQGEESDYQADVEAQTRGS